MAATALSVALLAAPASAQRMNSFEISAFGGGYFGSTVYATTGGQNVGLNTSWEWGARLGYNFTPGFGVEFSWSGTDPNMQFNGYTTTRPAGSLGINNYDFDAMFNFGQQRVWGYFALGLGWSSFSPSIDTAGVAISRGTQDYFSGNTAIGMKAFINPHLALQFDARYRWSNTNHQTGSGAACYPPYYYCYYYSSSYYGAGELTLGLTYVGFKN
ncbi:MAG TPA: outer membrane beta-barrel protein [Gemmatimonadaceae bacterium]|nr:outer membrane beta-barrel protein [Gemmatimonadaceae bacterium]